MPVRLRAHVKYPPRPPVTAQPKPSKLSSYIKRPEMDNDILADLPTDVIMRKFGVTYASVKGRKAKLRRLHAEMEGM